jgi:hypothetical protein
MSSISLFRIDVCIQDFIILSIANSRILFVRSYTIICEIFDLDNLWAIVE